MKNFLLLLIFLGTSTFAQAQWTTSFHISNRPFVGVNKQLGERWLPEFRVDVDNSFDYTGLELVVNYIFVKKDSYQFYGGLGGRANYYSGVVIPAGLNIYPFENKSFGFQMELAGVVGELSYLRGSTGIRYRFNKN
ncbi:hypothetical protein LV84_01566 [Algoriphagus ratkowskyi]|uniref:Uncharacterized protein n=1 Tax=Algoriphagus ratkowskyi TaxID=57028 RepID=A0A2W7RIX5_9BACT|nr:hypothetical protein [Algoriphagus ratkowskyi]PZX58360.1 hypothetical protein LV84_01566 [Algoriphagus ratkowskyi]TXD77771.1 hypothetical protein ESW18_10390 [Algoriphagus ratkowskyi]